MCGFIHVRRLYKNVDVKFLIFQCRSRGGKEGGGGGGGGFQESVVYQNFTRLK